MQLLYLRDDITVVRKMNSIILKERMRTETTTRGRGMGATRQGRLQGSGYGSYEIVLLREISSEREPPEGL